MTPVKPRAVIDCGAGEARIIEYYHWAHRYARAASLYFARLGALPVSRRGSHWDNGKPLAAGKWFGEYSAESFEFVRQVFHGVLRRMESGYRGKGPVRFVCLATNQERCGEGVLANAREFGTVRICPRLMERPARAGGVVVLHEILHQGLGVSDQRHGVCRRGGESRCYRQGALRLIGSGHDEIAIRNNDNYAYFAREAYRALHRSGKEGG